MSDFKFIPLKCPNCGAKLDVSADMERFSCGYCGTDLIAERKGGTIALKPLTDAIHRVQVGTDRTAAELAIRRLKDEIVALQTRQAERRQLFEDYADSERTAYDEAMARRVGVAWFVMLGGVVFAVALGIGHQSTGIALLAGIVVFCVSRGLQELLWHQKETDSLVRIDAAETTMQEDLDAIESEIAAMQPRIDEQKRIANL